MVPRTINDGNAMRDRLVQGHALPFPGADRSKLPAIQQPVMLADPPPHLRSRLARIDRELCASGSRFSAP